MADPNVVEIGRVTDLDGIDLRVGIDYDAVTIGDFKLSQEQAEAFAQLFAAACWAAPPPRRPA